MKPTMLAEESLSQEDVVRLQEAAWKQTYRYAFDHSPLYRDHFSRAGLDPEEVPPLKELSSIPPMPKSTLSERNEDLLSVPREEIVDIVTTSGTTGAPLVSMLTEGDLQRLGYNEYLSFRCAGLTSRDTVLLAVTLDRCFIAGMAYFLGLRMLGCGVVRIGPATPRMHFDMMERVQPTAIVSVPSFLRRMADAAEEISFDLRDGPVKHAVCIGEPVRNRDLSLNEAGQAVEAAWDAKTYATYGNTELATSLCECPAGAGGHLHPELIHVEILDDEGRPVPEGEVGEVTATAFGIEGMPVIRYSTGDCAALYTQPCACGRTTPRLGPIVGRRGHKLKVKGTTLFPSAFQTAVETVPGIDAHVTIATSPGSGSDHVELIVATTRDREALIRELGDACQGVAKVVPEIRIAPAEEIEALQMPEGARKRRVFVDRR